MFVTWLVKLKSSGDGGEDVICVRSSMDAKKISAERRRRPRNGMLKENFHNNRIKIAPAGARFKICALATAFAGLVEIQTLRSVYETQNKKTA